MLAASSVVTPSLCHATDMLCLHRCSAVLRDQLRAVSQVGVYMSVLICCCGCQVLCILCGCCLPQEVRMHPAGLDATREGPARAPSDMPYAASLVPPLCRLVGLSHLVKLLATSDSQAVPCRARRSGGHKRGAQPRRPACATRLVAQMPTHAAGAGQIYGYWLPSWQEHTLPRLQVWTPQERGSARAPSSCDMPGGILWLHSAGWST